MTQPSNTSPLAPLPSLKAGFWAGLPIVIGILPFGLIYGAMAHGLGLSLKQTQGMSLIVFAGASQLVFLDLWGQGVSVMVLILTCLVINLRMAMYSASIHTQISSLKGIQALAGSYLLTDESYGVSMGRFLSKGPFPYSRPHFYLGAGLPTWVFWQLSGLAGYLVGAILPPQWPLGMAAPLVFLALLASMVSPGPKLSAALAAGLVALLGAGLPMNLGLILAVAVGIFCGLAHEKYFRRPS